MFCLSKTAMAHAAMDQCLRGLFSINFCEAKSSLLMMTVSPCLGTREMRSQTGRNKRSQRKRKRWRGWRWADKLSVIQWYLPFLSAVKGIQDGQERKVWSVLDRFWGVDCSHVCSWSLVRGLIQPYIVHTEELAGHRVSSLETAQVQCVWKCILLGRWRTSSIGQKHMAVQSSKRVPETFSFFFETIVIYTQPLEDKLLEGELGTNQNQPE